MTTALSNVIAAPPSDSELMIRRLFKVAEILSRRQASVEAREFSIENSPEKQADEEIGYPETKDQLNDSGSRSV